MYNYSPISKLYVKNFRNIGEVEIDFTKSPIVTLVGENEAGKTSVIKAFSVCALHANPRDQKDYIRQGTNMFGVAIDLEDGTRITRIKETNANVYSVKHPDGTVWSTNKITDGLPIEVQNVMGLIEEPETKEFLHIRTYEDRLLFVVTPNSTNYKVMYNALKVEQLTNAIKIGSTEANSLKSAINTNEISIQTLGNQLRGITVYDVEPLVDIKDRIENKIKSLNKLKRAQELTKIIEEKKQNLGAVQLIDKFNLQTVDEVKSSRLISISRLLNNIYNLDNKYNSIKEVDTLDYIECDKIAKAENIIDKMNSLNKKVNDANALMQVNSMNEIYEGYVIQLNKAKSLLSKISLLKSQLNSINVENLSEINEDRLNKIDKVISMINVNTQKNNELTVINDNICKIHDYLKQCGVAVEACPKCGEAVIFDIDAIS